MVGRAFLVITPAILVFAAERIPAETEPFRSPSGFRPTVRLANGNRSGVSSARTNRTTPTCRTGGNCWANWAQLATNEVYFRTHNLLTSGDGTPALKWGSTGAYTEDQQGNPVYNWTILDRIFDTYRNRGVRPYVEIGFMPEALSIKPEPYQHHWTPKAKYNEIYTGWAYPPKDYAKWSELVFQWAKHDVERYGRAEVANWYWETWNEANIGYWQGTPEEFFRLHD